MIPETQTRGLQNAAPFWMSLGLIPLAAIAAYNGGWTLFLVPVYVLLMTTAVDSLSALELRNADTETPDSDLFWHRLVTLIWFPIQFVLIFGSLWWVSHHGTLSGWEQIALFYGVGVISGSIGINYSHELMHQSDRRERFLGDLLLASVMYSHFRSEHLLGHHRYVGTPRDPVTARYNESFYRFFPRILWQCIRSAWREEAAMLARRGLPVWHVSNSFWRYFVLQSGMLLLAYLIGGWDGVGLFYYQAVTAILFLELVNYIEHYGLTRKHLGGGKYEHVLPRHSWNSAHRMTNWLLINLQRHSDHHYKPNRRYPLLQTYSEADAPQLPFGYPIMGVLALIPPSWRRVMNPRVRKWRGMYYPEITDWSAYTEASNPLPGT